MCGRYTLHQQQWVDTLLAGEIGILPAELRRPRFNIAPGQMVLTIQRAGTRAVAEAMHWGIEAPWRGGPTQLINARAEKLGESRFWRPLLEQGRCAIPADGFYEWRTVEGAGKQPYWFGRDDGEPFAFAGLCRAGDGQSQSCVIVTVEANELVAAAHDRMPAMLDRAGIDAWIGDDSAEALAALSPYPSAEMTARPVSSAVNRAGGDGPELIEAVDPIGPDQRPF
ncbi:MAG: SOS response-associated peptidase [Actinobacteria bacterium]|nr:SOS response-associated peptidase [Actinomycetota bacterium]